MKHFIIEKIVLPSLYLLPLALVVFMSYDIYERRAGLIEACQTLGGVYVDNTICIAGKNLFAK
jgi:hypothetical protein